MTAMRLVIIQAIAEAAMLKGRGYKYWGPGYRTFICDKLERAYVAAWRRTWRTS